MQERYEIHPSLYIKNEVSVQDSMKSVSYEIKHSRHSKKRASQRAISEVAIFSVLDYGTPFYRQGMIFYAVKHRNLPTNMPNDLKKKIRNLVVIIGGFETAEIVTCYWCRKPMRYLKRKSKRLSRCA